MARRRTRRNPVRTTGALIINPRRRRRNKSRRTRRNALQIRTNRKRRTNTRRRRRNVATNLQIRKNRRRSRRRNTRSRRRNTRARRRNGTRKGMRRKTARRAYSRRRNGTRKGMRRRTARRAYMKRRNRRKTRKNMASMLKKIPLIGGTLAHMASLAPTALFGAVMVEPTMMAAKLLGRYVPNLPAPLFYAIAGLLVAAVVKSKFIPLAPSTKDKLAIAAASAAGGVAYYKFRTSGGAPETTAEEVGALELRGYSGPFGLLELRGNGMHSSHSMSGMHSSHSMSGYGDYGPAAVMPLGTY